MRRNKLLLLAPSWMNLIKYIIGWKKGNTKEHIIYDSIYIKSKTKQNSAVEIEVSLVVTSIGRKRAWTRPSDILVIFYFTICVMITHCSLVKILWAKCVWIVHFYACILYNDEKALNLPDHVNILKILGSKTLLYRKIPQSIIHHFLSNLFSRRTSVNSNG